jgi:hypothetical protein
MATDKNPEHKALNPFFDVAMKGLSGFVDGEHFYSGCRGLRDNLIDVIYSAQVPTAHRFVYAAFLLSK